MFYEWQPKTPLAIAVFFVAFFVVTWCAVGFALAWLGGWRHLAGEHRHDGGFDGPRWHFRSASMRRGVHYNNYIAVFFVFRIAQPALFIPWSDIEVVERKGLIKYVEFNFQFAWSSGTIAGRAAAAP